LGKFLEVLRPDARKLSLQPFTNKPGEPWNPAASGNRQDKITTPNAGGNMKIAKLQDILNVNNNPQGPRLIGQRPWRTQPCNKQNLDTGERARFRFIADPARRNSRISE
jgi:hypothetical protein